MRDYGFGPDFYVNNVRGARPGGRSFREWSALQPEERTAGVPLTREEEDAAGISPFRIGAQFLGTAGASVVRNLGNMGDFAAAISPTRMGDFITGAAEGKGPLEIIADRTAETGIAERLTDPVSDAIMGAIGDPRNKAELAARMGGMLTGEVASMYGGGAALRGAYGGLRTATALARGTQAAAPAIGTALATTSKAKRAAAIGRGVLRQTGRETALASPYNVANAFDPEDNLATGLASLAQFDDGTGGFINNTAGFLGRVGEATEGDIGRTLALEQGTDVGIGGGINAIGAAMKFGPAARLTSPIAGAVGQMLRDAADRGRDIAGAGVVRSGLAGVGNVDGAAGPSQRMAAGRMLEAGENQVELMEPGAAPGFRTPEQAQRRRSANLTVEGVKPTGVDARIPSPPEPDYTIRETMTPESVRPDMSRAASAVSRTTPGLEPTASRPLEEVITPEDVRLDMSGARSAVGRTTPGLEPTGGLGRDIEVDRNWPPAPEPRDIEVDRNWPPAPDFSAARSAAARTTPGLEPTALDPRIDAPEYALNETLTGPEDVRLTDGTQGDLFDGDVRSAGSEARLRASQASDVSAAAPANVGATGGGLQKVKNLADEFIRDRRPDLADEYPSDPEYLPLPEYEGREIADLYDRAPDMDDSEEVLASYEAFKRETKEQYEFLVERGVKFEPWTKEGQPYANSAEMIKDIQENNRLFFFLTEEGFGEEGAKAAGAHPLLEPAGVKLAGKEMTYNDLFRAVHDFFGHSKEGFQFGPRGENNAWGLHAAMYSPEARGAMGWETRGQNSWVNFGQHLRREDGSLPRRGEEGYVHPKDRPYAAPKVGVLPSEYGDIRPKGPAKTLMAEVAQSLRDGAEGATIDPVTGANRAGTDAYSVAMYPDRELRVPYEEPLDELVSGYTRDNWDLLGKEGNELGIWHDKETGDLVFDVARVFTDRDEAVAAMKAGNEKAAFDLKKMEDIVNPDFDPVARRGVGQRASPSVDRSLEDMGAQARQADREAVIRETLQQAGILGLTAGAAAAGGADEDKQAAGLTMAAVLLSPALLKKHRGKDLLEIVNGMTLREVGEQTMLGASEPRHFAAALIHLDNDMETIAARLTERFGKDIDVDATVEGARDVYKQILDRLIPTPHRPTEARLSTKDELIELANKGIDSKNWYRGVRTKVESIMSKDDAHMFIRFLAATSPQSDAYTNNIDRAKRAFLQWKLGADEAAGLYISNKRATEVMQGAQMGEFGGEKLSNYTAGLMGSRFATTYDDWHGRAMGTGGITWKKKGDKQGKVISFNKEDGWFYRDGERVGRFNPDEVDTGRTDNWRNWEWGDKVPEADQKGLSYKGNPAATSKTADSTTGTSEYLFGAEITREIAGEGDLTDTQTQAAIWGGIKKVYGELGLSRFDEAPPYARKVGEHLTGEPRNLEDALVRALITGEKSQNFNVDKAIKEFKDRWPVFADGVSDRFTAEDRKNMLKAITLIGTPAATMGFTVEDERKMAGLNALAIMLGGHTAAKLGAFRPIRPVGDTAWSLMSGGGEWLRQKANQKSWGLFRRESDAGPDFSRLMSSVRREIAQWQHDARELQKRVMRYGEAFNTQLSRSIDLGENSEQFASRLRAKGITAEDAKVIDEIHETFKELGESLVAKGFIGMDSFQRWSGRYAPRLYEQTKGFGSRTFDETGSLDPDALSSLDRAMFRADDPVEGKALIEDGAYRAALGMIQEGHLAAVGRLMETVSGNREWTDGSVFDLGRRLDALEANRRALGYGDQPIEPEKLRMVDDFIARTKTEFQQAQREAKKKGFVQMPEHRMYGALSGKMVKPEVKSALVAHGTVTTEVDKIFNEYDRILRMWKKSRTVWNPATHGRNLLGAQLLSYLGGGPVPLISKSYRTAVAQLRNGGELAEKARKNGLLDSGAAGGLLIGASAGNNLAKPNKRGAVGYVPNMIGNVDRKLTNIYQYGDVLSRVAHFDHAMRVRGMSEADAAADALKWVPTYDNLSKFSRAWSRFGAPFWSYSAVALPRVAEATVKHPIRFMTFGTLAYAMEKMFTDYDPPDELLPAEARGLGHGMFPDAVVNVFEKVPGSEKFADAVRFMSPTRFAWPSFSDDPDRMTFGDATYTLPYGDIAEGRGRQTGSPFASLPSNFNPGQIGGPLVQQVKELTNFNRSAFLDRPIYEQGASSWENIKTTADYFTKNNLPALTPQIPGLTQGGYGYQRLRDAFLNRPNYAGDVRGNVSAVMDAIFGFKQRQLDMPVELGRRISERESEIRSIESMIRDVQRNPNASESYKENYTNKKVQQIGRLYDEIAGLIEAGEGVGVSPERRR